MRGVVVANAVIGEPEAAMGIEDEIVRGPQRAAIAVGVQVGDRAGREVDALDAPADVVGRVEPTWEHQTTEIDRREAAAVVAQVQRAVGADGRTVGPTDDLRHRLLGAVGMDSRDARPEHLHQDHTAVRHGDRALGKSQP